MAHTDEFKRKLRLGTACTLLGALSVSGFNASIAQDAAADDEEFAVEEVVVTGSRIKRTGFDTVNPATVVNSEFLELRGLNNVADALNQLPSFGIPGASNNGGQNGQNVGQNFVNAFGLGSQRTLTLINGRRTVSQASVTTVGIGTTVGSGLQVDLNTVPTQLIDRIETVFTGGAPIYGSDAIAGTVNVILKDDFEGFNFDAEYGISQEGDAENYRFRSLVGGNFADGRGNVVVSMEYAKQDGLLTNARPIRVARDAGFVNNPADTGPSDGIADQNFTLDTNGVFQVLEPGIPIFGATSHRLGTTNTGLLFSGGRDDQGNGIGVPLIFGINGGFVDAAVANIGTIPRNANGTQSLFFSVGANAINNPYVLSTTEANSIISPLERYTFSQLSHYDLTENIRWFSEAMYSRSESTDQLNQPAWSTVFFGPGQGGLLQVNIRDNPYVTDEMRDILILNGAYNPDDPSDQFLNISRTNTDIQQGNENRRSQDSFRFVTGFEGDFEAFGRDWSWDMSYSYGETNAMTSAATINGERYALAIDAITDPTTGRPTCRTSITPPANPQPGGVRSPATPSDITNCVPVNIIGYNQFGQNVRDYLIQNTISTLELQQSVIEGSIAGDLLDLPAGPVGFAVGVTHRRERAAFRNDQGRTIGIDPTVPAGDVVGGFETDEIYTEMAIPLVADGEGLGPIGAVITDFDIDGAVRLVDNSVAGSDYTWTIGGRLKLNIPEIGDALTLRGGYTEAIRSPSVAELFSPQVQANFFANDPCEQRFIQLGNNPTARRANCEAQFAQLQAAGNINPGVTLGTYESIITNASQPGLTGGNPNLQNETSTSYTLGFVFEPDFVPGLTISSDYTNIELTNVIVSLTATQVAEACYDSNNFPNEPACSQFTRQAGTFQFQNPITGQSNAARRRLEAIITNVSYTFDMADISESLDGTMNLTANHFLSLSHDLQVGSADLTNLDTELGQERHRWQANATYQLDRFAALLQWRHVGGGAFDADATQERRDIFRFKDVNVFNATLRYQINDTISARFIVNNVFNNYDHATRQAATGNALNFTEAVGRRFLFGINANF